MARGQSWSGPWGVVAADPTGWTNAADGRIDQMAVLLTPWETRVDEENIRAGARGKRCPEHKVRRWTMFSNTAGCRCM